MIIGRKIRLKKISVANRDVRKRRFSNFVDVLFPVRLLICQYIFYSGWNTLWLKVCFSYDQPLRSPVVPDSPEKLWKSPFPYCEVAMTIVCPSYAHRMPTVSPEILRTSYCVYAGSLENDTVWPGEYWQDARAQEKRSHKLWHAYGKEIHFLLWVVKKGL